MEFNRTYNILWFDDDFEPINLDESHEENTTRDAFYEDVSYANEYGLNVVGVWNLQDFENKIKDYRKYQAVIFDLRGLDYDNKFNDSIMPKAYKMVESLPNIEIFIYSANLNDRYFGSYVESLEDHTFNKGLGVDPLYKKIREVLDNNHHYYRNHEECLALFNEGILSYANRTHMDELLRKYEAKDGLYSPYNSMRHILEDMLNKLQEYRIIRIVDNGDKIETFNLKMKYLAEDYYFKKNADCKSVLDYDNPKVPFELCRREIKYAMKFLKDITNHYSHFLEKNPNYLKEYDSYGCNLLIQQSAYKAFFAAMKWYYSLMHGRPNKALGPFPVEKDEQGFFYCGKEYSVSPITLRDNCITVGDFVYILYSVPNENEKTQGKYRFYAKQIAKKE